MRTPQEAYNEAIQILGQRIASADRSVAPCKETYKLTLQLAIDQLKLSFSGVFSQVASTQELPAELQQIVDNELVQSSNEKSGNQSVPLQSNL